MNSAAPIVVTAAEVFEEAVDAVVDTQSAETVAAITVSGKVDEGTMKFILLYVVVS